MAEPIRGPTDNEDEALLPFSEPEIRQIWSFLDGSIMDIGTRHHLWKSWGLCPRHAWCCVIAEIEIRGGQPFSATILYEDLIDRAARLISRTKLLPWGLVVSRLKIGDSCFTCDYVALASGWRDSETAQRRERVNAVRRTLPLLADKRDLWLGTSCPNCLGGGGLVCRPHLLEGVEPAVDRDALAQAILDLRRRLHALHGSMTWGGRPATLEQSIAWIEGVCWFTGWRFPMKLLEEPHGKA